MLGRCRGRWRAFASGGMNFRRQRHHRSREAMGGKNHEAMMKAKCQQPCTIRSFLLQHGQVGGHQKGKESQQNFQNEPQMPQTRKGSLDVTQSHRGRVSQTAISIQRRQNRARKAFHDKAVHSEKEEVFKPPVAMQFTAKETICCPPGLFLLFLCIARST